MGISDFRTDYEAPGLDIADVHLDPIEQWWRWYREAEAAGCVEANAMTLATVDAEGRPDARYVLLRGAAPAGFDFYTNRVSVKGRHLAAHPYAALVFGWLELHRQVRVRGTVGPVPEPEADAYWASRPRGASRGSAGRHRCSGSIPRVTGGSDSVAITATPRSRRSSRAHG